MIKILKNAPFEITPTIKIVEGSQEWDIAYKNWLSGKNPTDSPEWKKGIFFGFTDQANQ